jgi:hypothetical protein
VIGEEATGDLRSRDIGARENLIRVRRIRYHRRTVTRGPTVRALTPINRYLLYVYALQAQEEAIANGEPPAPPRAQHHGMVHPQDLADERSLGMDQLDAEFVGGSDGNFDGAGTGGQD